MSVRFFLNGQPQNIPEKQYLLIDYLRYQLNLTGTKAACREGDCGSCQVLVCEPVDEQEKGSCIPDYRSQTSCLLRLQDLKNHHVITIEGLKVGFESGGTKALNPMQKILADSGASQCGFCSPGLVIGILNWLLNGPKLTVEEGEAWINGNLCRCKRVEIT